MISVITVISILGRGGGRDGAGDRAGDQQRLSQHAAAQPAGRDRARDASSRRRPAPASRTGATLTAKLQKIPHVTSAAPTLYGAVYMSGPIQSTGGILKGIDVNSGPQMNDVLRHLKAGSVRDLDRKEGLPGIILGTRLAQQTGMMPGSMLKVMSPHGEMTPFGPRPQHAALQGGRAVRVGLLRTRRHLGLRHR